MTNKEYTDEAVRLLKLLISTPSTSRSEDKAADIMEETIRGYELEVHRLKNNEAEGGELRGVPRPYAYIGYYTCHFI